MRGLGLGAGRLFRFGRSVTLRILWLSMAGAVGAFGLAAADDQAAECVGCHAFQAQMVVLGGGKHATAVGCADCHPQHPPEADHVLTACTDCHEGQPHYRINNCQHCHVDAHMPITHLRDPVKPARAECLSCHAGVGEQMAAEPSQHAQLFCNRCHPEHKQVPTCLDCHSPHLGDQTEADCRVCHPAHQPRRVVLTRYIPVKFCRSCHAQEARDVATVRSKHRQLNCVYCHRGRHTSTLGCGDCHGLPHSRPLHRQHTDCLSCHGSAHRLISGR